MLRIRMRSKMGGDLMSENGGSMISLLQQEHRAGWQEGVEKGTYYRYLKTLYPDSDKNSASG